MGWSLQSELWLGHDRCLRSLSLAERFSTVSGAAVIPTQHMLGTKLRLFYQVCTQKNMFYFIYHILDLDSDFFIIFLTKIYF